MAEERNLYIVSGYNVTLLYFWLHSPELALQRVAERVSKGGHNVAERKI